MGMEINPPAKSPYASFALYSPHPRSAVNYEKLNLLLNYFPLISQISNRIFFIPCLHFLAESRTNKLIPLRAIRGII